MDASLATNPIAQTFARQGYAVVRALVPGPTVAAVRAHLEQSAAAGKMRMQGDDQVPGTPSAHGDPLLDNLMQDLCPAIEACTGLALWPTYSYARLYKHGDTLLPHRDRAACEISVSLNLGQVPDEPWALYVKGAAGTAEALLRPGDVLLYRGIDLIHWRHAYEGQHLAQVFLHYVDQNGPHRNEKFDRRPTLGTVGVR
jgi:alkylated DNA repair dioxygenase AlkB